jgi:hypothetical protein
MRGNESEVKVSWGSGMGAGLGMGMIHTRTILAIILDMMVVETY